MNNWTFGIKVGLTWNTTRSVQLKGVEGTADATLTGLPTFFRPSIDTTEGCFTISDSDGNLLFYSDEERVWDKTNTIMPNGMGLSGNKSSAQSGIIFPYPGSKTKYVVVTLGIYNTTNLQTAYYSVIDMSLRGNLGDVVATEKNKKLPNGIGAISESCTATLAADGSYWIIAPGRGNPTQLQAWKFTKAGIATSPVITPIPYSTRTNGNKAYGCMKISHDNKYFAWGLYDDQDIMVGNFDDITGKFSNVKTIPNPGLPYGVEFSPSLKYLFVGGAGSDDPLSSAVCRVFLKVLGYKWKRTRLSLKDKRDQDQFDKQQIELEHLKELHRMGYIDLYYCDESHFGLTPNVGYAWQHKDNPILLPAAKSRRLSVFGLMTPDCKFCSWMVEGSINSNAVIEILDKFATRIIKKTIVVIDNAPIHRSKKFMAKIAEWKLQDLLIYFLPPYCPELNLIEILWKHIKYYWMPFDAFLNFQNLKERLSNTLNQIGTKWQIKFC